MVQQIVGNLIDNARKYTRDAADKRIWVWAKPGVRQHGSAGSRGSRRGRAGRASGRASSSRSGAAIRPIARPAARDWAWRWRSPGRRCSAARLTYRTPRMAAPAPASGSSYRESDIAGGSRATHRSNDYSVTSNSAAGHGGGSSRRGMAGAGIVARSVDASRAA